MKNKTVLSSFQENENFEKNLNKFLVPMLVETSEYLGIATVDTEGKKVFNKQKSTLVRKIVSKIMSLLRALYLECQDTYSVPLRTKSIFNCVKYDRGSHDCNKITSFHRLLTNDSPQGMV